MSIEVKNLSFAYDTRPILKDISFTAPGGQLLAVLGPNGAGKSTLFKCLLGLLSGYTGQTLLDGVPMHTLSPAALARTIAYVPQSHYPSFNYSVFDMVLMGTTAQVSSISTPGEEQVRRSMAALEKLGIEHLKDRGYMHLSGGEQQLVLLARAMAQQAKLLIMDEPTSNLDYGNQLRVLQQTKALTRDGYAIVQSTHNPDHAFLFADRVLAIADAQVIAYGPPAEVLTSQLIYQLYGVHVEVEQRGPGQRNICIPMLGP
ncbi:MAG: ABC transporter ATP-binding protein [Oscillospiraceae bacterium]